MKTIILSQAKLNGSTGTIHFNEYGKRKGVELEILNLRNNSFQKVSENLFNSYVHEVVFKSYVTLDYIYHSKHNVRMNWMIWN